MISFRSSPGISSFEIYRLKISKANSWKLYSRQCVCQSEGSEGISSGMNKPPSFARPFSTTSSNENCEAGLQRKLPNALLAIGENVHRKSHRGCSGNAAKGYEVS